jgi:serine/threonine protein phosphatase PrpC
MFSVTKHIQSGGHELQDRAEYFWQGANLILVIADGAGGMSGGAEAAEFVVRRVKEAVKSDALKIEELREFLVSTDQHMAAAQTFGETTCVIAALSNKKIVGASVGDSEAWLVSQTGIEKLTTQQRRKPFLGSGSAMPVSFEREQLSETLLIATDGLFKYTGEDKIASEALIVDLEQAAQKLIELVRYPSGALPDDVSVILARKT